MLSEGEEGDAEMAQEAAGVRRDFCDTIGPRHDLNVASPDKQAAGTDDLAVSAQGQVGSPATNIQVEKPLFRMRAR